MFLLNKKKENFDGDAGSGSDAAADNAAAKAVGNVIKIFILLLILDIILIIFAMYCLFASGLAWYFVIPLFILLITPGIGTAVALGLIIYHFVNKNKKMVAPTARYHFF